MAKNSIFAILLRSPWWVSGLVAIALALIGLALMPPGYRIYGMLTGVPFSVICIAALKKQWGTPGKARTAEMLEKIRALSWREFADEIEVAFRRDGFDVKRVEMAEADFSVTSEGRTALVSCRRWKVANTGIEPLRELWKAVERDGLYDALYVTTGEFTQTAMEFAVEKKIRLIRGAALAKLMREMKTVDAKSAKKA
jgi:restriction system protein